MALSSLSFLNLEGSENIEHTQEASNGDVDESRVYKTDEFRMYCFKVLPCSKRFCHDWTKCPFAHPGEKARRRDPRVFHYVGIACPEMKTGKECPRTASCPFAHNVFEYWLHPCRYRTQPCNDGSECSRKVCFFAHTLEELRVPDSNTENGVENNATSALEGCKGFEPAREESHESAEVGLRRGANKRTPCSSQDSNITCVNEMTGTASVEGPTGKGKLPKTKAKNPVQRHRDDKVSRWSMSGTLGDCHQQRSDMTDSLTSIIGDLRLNHAQECQQTYQIQPEASFPEGGNFYRAGLWTYPPIGPPTSQIPPVSNSSHPLLSEASSPSFTTQFNDIMNPLLCDSESLRVQRLGSAMSHHGPAPLQCSQNVNLERVPYQDWHYPRYNLCGEVFGHGNWNRAPHDELVGGGGTIHGNPTDAILHKGFIPRKC
ncbi:hypothetical protein BSKO_11811 [Bryopsis sp. KO-2023]|nr:hypothetical protein BSKO_11811 [Bryopsis sp. KO-2023]